MVYDFSFLGVQKWIKRLEVEDSEVKGSVFDCYWVDTAIKARLTYRARVNGALASWRSHKTLRCKDKD